MNTDPRKAKDLDDACANGNDTYNGIRMMSWLTEVMKPGKGLSEDEVREIVAEVQSTKTNRGDV